MYKHIPPTVKQRLAIFKKVKQILTENKLGTNSQFICLAIEVAQKSLRYVKYTTYDNDSKFAYMKWSLYSANVNKTDCMKVNFPELHKRKPSGKEMGCAWWVSKDGKVNPTRLRVVNEIIEELEAQIENKS